MKFWDKIWKGILTLGIISGSCSIVGGIANVSAAIYDVTIIDLDWLGFFDGICRNKYEDKYNQAIYDMQKEDYLEAFKLFKVVDLGLKYDVSYTKDDIKENSKECIAKYTAKKIEAANNYLITGKKDTILNDGVGKDNQIIDKSRKEEVADLLKKVKIVDKFKEVISERKYIEAIEIYSINKLDGCLKEDLKIVIEECEKIVLDEINKYLNDEQIDEANKIYKLIKTYSTNTTLMEKIRIEIKGHQEYKIISNYYDKEDYLEVIKYVNKNPELKKYDTINSIYNDSSSKYVNSIVEDVELLEKENKFDELKNKLTISLTHIKSDRLSDLLKKYSEYNNREVWFYNTISNSGNSGFSKENQLYINNKLYFKVFKFYNNSSLIIKNNHKFLSGNCFVSYDDIQDEGARIKIFIYGDRQLLELIELNKYNYEQYFSKNIEGYDTVNITIETENCYANSYIENIQVYN